MKGEKGYPGKKRRFFDKSAEDELTRKESPIEVRGESEVTTNGTSKHQPPHFGCSQQGMSHFLQPCS